jgi:ankyrin repeat protein
MRQGPIPIAIFVVLLSSLGGPRVASQSMSLAGSYDQVYQSLLWRVVAHGSPDLIRYLFDSGSDMFRILENGKTMLSIAAGENPDAEVVRIFLEHGSSPNMADQEGFTPLMAAAGAGRLETVRILLGAGAEVNARSRRGYTALHAATGSKDAELVLVLLAAGADPSLVFDGLTPLDFALRNPAFAGSEVLKRLGAPGR